MHTTINAADFISANLPSIDFDQTQVFYRILGFECAYKSAEWMILNRQGLILEFFHHPELDVSQSWHSACIRIMDMQGLYNEWSTLKFEHDVPFRLTEIEDLGEIQMFCLIDPNGSLLRCIQRESR